jgi:protein-disulfide isomerase
MKNKIVIIAVAAIVMIGAFVASLQFYKSKKSENLETEAKTNFSKFVPEDAPKLGSTTPKVYLVEFLDPECESCREFYPYVKMLLQEYEGKIQLVVRYAPFHPNSKLAIKILEAARRQGKFWETLEVLFRYQPQWGSHHDPKPDLMWNYLPEAGVDVNKLRSDIVEYPIDDLIEREKKDGADLGVRATPTFFVNGKQLEVFSYDALKEMVQKELEK